MNCNCKWTETILAIVIIVFAIWPALISSATVGKWIVVAAAVLLLIHAWSCKNCGVKMHGGMVKSSGKRRR